MFLIYFVEAGVNLMNISYFILSTIAVKYIKTLTAFLVTLTVETLTINM